MPNLYLLPQDYAAFGITASSSTAQQVMQASLLIDALTKKPAGLLYGVDANSEPAYMTKPKASYMLTATNGIAAGNSITCMATGALQALANGASYGQTVLIDRANPLVTESCIIQSVDLINRTITLLNVQFAHAPGALLEAGLSIFEERFLPEDRTVTNVSYTPVRRILGVQGELTYPRRSEVAGWPYASIIPYEFTNGINGQPVLQTINAANVQFNDQTGILYFPSTVYNLYFNDARIYYIAGWTYDSLPDDIKQACALLVTLSASASMIGNLAVPLTKYKAGGTEADFANLANITGSSAVDLTTANTITGLLAPYVRSLI